MNQRDTYKATVKDGKEGGRKEDEAIVRLCIFRCRKVTKIIVAI